MSCLKILVLCFVAQCCAHHANKRLNRPKYGSPFDPVALAMEKRASFDGKKVERVIKKRQLDENVVTLGLDAHPAPVMEHVEDKQDIEAAPTLFGFVRPEPILNRPPLRTNNPGLNVNKQESIPQGVFNPPVMRPEPMLDRVPLRNGLNTNIRESIPQSEVINTPNMFVPRPVDFYEGLPPRPVQPIPAIGPTDTQVVPLLVPPTANPVPQSNEETSPPGLFNRLNVRRYAVYAGDVILKYLSQFFNRARITFNRFTTPPSPTPVYDN